MGSNVSTTTTTTTTVITRVTDTMYLAVSNPSAVKDSEIMGKMVGMSLAKMAGFGTDTSVLTADMPTVAESMAVTYHFDVSNLHKVKPDEVKTNMAAHTDAQINAMLAMHIGTCGYTVTKARAPSGAGGDGATSSAHSVRNMARCSVIVTEHMQPNVCRTRLAFFYCKCLHAELAIFAYFNACETFTGRLRRQI